MLWWDSNFPLSSTFVCSFRTFILYYGLRLLDLITIIDQGTDCRMWERAALWHNSGPSQMRGPSVGRSSVLDNLPRVMLRSTPHKPYIYPCMLSMNIDISCWLMGKLSYTKCISEDMSFCRPPSSYPSRGRARHHQFRHQTS